MRPLFFLFGFALLMGCGNKSKLDLDDYINYVENTDNGLRQEKKVDKMIYILQYKPLEYMAAFEQRNSEFKDSTWRKRIEEMTDLQCYTLRLMSADKSTDIGTMGINSASDGNARNSYMSFDMQNDIYLIDGSDSLYCGIFHYVNNYGLAPYADFVIAFENKNQQITNDKTFVFEDNVFGGGKINFLIRKSDIENAPTLKTN